MEGNYITKEVHDEFARRMEAENQRLEDEDKRQNRRISALEENVKEIHGLTVSMGNLIEKQNSRIDEIEKEPAKDSKQLKMAVITSVITTVVGAIIGAVLVLILK